MTSDTNEVLRKYHEDHAELIQDLAGKSQIVADIEEAVSQAESAAAETDALLYEANFLDVHTLWRMAQGPRRRVFAIRDRVFGVRSTSASGLGDARGKRYPAASHGRFNRVQRCLDGSERLVDFLGRTESEVEEESALPEIMPDGAESDVEEEEEEAAAVERHLRAEEVVEEGQVKALSTWLLTLFTKWGRVLGVGGASASPSVVSADALGASVEPKDPYELEHDQQHMRTLRAARGDREKPKTGLGITNGNLKAHGNGHGHGHNRLSTVGEEEEDEESDTASVVPSSPEIALSMSASDSGGLKSESSS